MVLESILRPKNAEKKPWHVFVIAVIYSFIAVFFANALFPEQSSVLAIALITIIFVPFFQRLFVYEEKTEKISARSMLEKNIISRHKGIIYVFSAFFIGIIVSMSFIYVFLPVKDVFLLQESKLNEFSATGMAANTGDFASYFYNNTQVMFLMFVLSAMLGAGAIFVLVWNASVIATYAGIFAQSLISKGMSSGAAFILGVPASLGSIALHGIPEIAAYFFAGIAGGVLSVGILREKSKSKEFRIVFKDSLVFLGIAEILILAAAMLETFV